MFSVAIDGPAGAGKSTIAKLIAKNLNFIYVDTGAMYRAVAFYLIENKKDIHNVKEITDCFDKIKITLEFTNGEQHIFLNGCDVSNDIRTPQISMGASDVSAIKEVRDFLLDTQRNLAKENNVVMDGRDIATTVLPNADVKIFLTASLEVRAKRRQKELIEKDINVTFKNVLNDIKTRDYNDSHREIAPLKPSDESVIVDSSNMPIDDVVEKILSIIKEKLA